MLTSINKTIPQNKNINFILTKNNTFKSIDILIYHSYEINLENLFLIFKSYLETETALLKTILIIAYNNDHGPIPIFHHINIKKHKRMKYIDFCI